MRELGDVLVASPSFEDRTSLLRILNDLSLNVICCSALDQAREVLSSRTIDLIFCDERLAEEDYCDLLPPVADSHAPRIMVTSHKYEGHTEVVREGAFGAIRFPLQPTDVELVVLRAMREERQAIYPDQGHH